MGITTPEVVGSAQPLSSNPSALLPRIGMKIGFRFVHASCSGHTSESSCVKLKVAVELEAPEEDDI